MDSKTLSFITMMGVLGNVLFAISYYAGNIAPGIAFDFSLIGAYIAGFYGGPLIGFISGMFVGLLPGIIFGPLGQSQWLGLFGLPFGKGLTGLAMGILAKCLKVRERKYSSILTIPLVFLAYIPECIFTYAFFEYLMPFFVGRGGAYMFYYILPKALVEITVMSFLIAALIGNNGFTEFIGKFLTKSYIRPVVRARES